MLHKNGFPGQKVPFGARVTYALSSTKKAGKESDLKMASPLGAGVYAGYKVHSGYRWKKEYLVWDLDDFVDLSLSPTRPSQSLCNPHVTHRCSLTYDRLSFL